jgi:hypothetical protein
MQSCNFQLPLLCGCSWLFIFLVVKGPAADATDALQPWGLLCNPVMKMKIMIIFCPFPSTGAPVEWNRQGKTEELGEKPVPVPLCPSQIPHGLTRDQTRASAVCSRLTRTTVALSLVSSRGSRHNIISVRHTHRREWTQPAKLNGRDKVLGLRKESCYFELLVRPQLHCVGGASYSWAAYAWKCAGWEGGGRGREGGRIRLIVIADDRKCEPLVAVRAHSSGWRETYDLLSKGVWFMQIEKNEMGGSCSTYGEKRGAYRILVGRPEGRRPLGRPRRRWERIILKCIFKKWDGAWTGLSWHRIGTSGGLLWMR